MDALDRLTDVDLLALAGALRRFRFMRFIHFIRFMRFTRKNAFQKVAA